MCCAPAFRSRGQDRSPAERCLFPLQRMDEQASLALLAEPGGAVAARRVEEAADAIRKANAVKDITAAGLFLCRTR